MVQGFFERKSEWMNKHKTLALILSVSAILLFVNLGNQYLYIDEANTAYLGKNTLKFGYPVAYDGKNILPPFFDGSLSKDLVWVEHPWAQYYLAAASLAVFGNTTFAARFPFALLGFLSIIVVYCLVLKIHRGNTGLANLAAVLLTLSVPFLLFARNSRYYALILFFGPLVVLTFLNWVEQPGRRTFAFFVLSSTLLFHSFFPLWFCLTFTIILYFIVFVPKRGRTAAFITAHLATALLIVPWIVYANPGPPAGIKVDFAAFIETLLIYFWKLHTYLLPFLPLLLILFILRVAQGSPTEPPAEGERAASFKHKEYFLFSSILLYIVMISTVPISSTQYLVSAIPFAVMVTAVLLWKIRRRSRAAFAVTLVLFLFTNILHISPFLLIEKSAVDPEKFAPFVKSPWCITMMTPPLSLRHYVYNQLEVRSYVFDHAYQLTHEYHNRVEGIVEYLIRNGKKDETVLASFGEAGLLMFYTDMTVLHHPFPGLKSETLKKLILHPVKNIDWVIPGGMYLPQDLAKTNGDTESEGADLTEYYRYDTDRYEKIYLAYPNVFFDPSPNIDFHEFRTVRTAPQNLYILKRKSV